MIPFFGAYNPSSNLANLHSFPNKETPKPSSSSILRPKSPLSSPSVNFGGAYLNADTTIEEVPIEEPKEILPEAAIQFYEEDVTEYRPGGYHPVKLGDIFNSKYEIIQKIGFGKFSTIWLAIDTTVEQPVALKILKANSFGIENDIHERETLKYAKGDDPKHMIGLVERFIHKGPNGNHVCLVFNKLEADKRTVVDNEATVEIGGE